VVGLVVAQLKQHRAGLRSEQLQKLLQLTKGELVRPITEALATGQIVKTGERRSTTYFAK
jgi:Fic family protein